MAGINPPGDCSSTRTIDRWEVRCHRKSSHTIHQAMLPGEDDRVVTLDWDDRPSWRSDITTVRLERDRAERRRRAKVHG